MNKKLLIGAAVGTAVVVGAVVSATKNQSGPKPTVWDKMRDHMEEMPEDFPPRMMFDNIEAIKANTEEILTLLRDQTRGSTTST
jgi:hypothetical protein